jgi:hypothetical protein
VAGDAGFIKALPLRLLVKAELEAVLPDGCQLPGMEYRVLLTQVAPVAGVVQIMQGMGELAV